MANRVLRDFTDSEKVDKLSAGAEVFYTRLFMKVDDFGSYYANPKLLKSNLFPLRTDKITDSEIAGWLNECKDAELIMLYESSDKYYLRILNFGQRLRNMRGKFPEPQQVAASRSESLPETDSETETETTPKQETESETEIFLPEKSINIDFDFFWDEYDKKTGSKEKLRKKWEKLTDKERASALNYIPKYKESQPDKQYRKNVETFLNNKSWNDEIIIRNNGKQTGNNERQQRTDEIRNLKNLSLNVLEGLAAQNRNGSVQG